MKLTVDFLKAKRACTEGLCWFETNFGSEADYQTVLNLLAKEHLASWASWVLQAVGPIDDVMEISADTTIDGYLFVAGNLSCTASLQVALSIKAGGDIKAGWGIKAGEGINAGEGYVIYCGLCVRRLSDKTKYAVVTARTRPSNVMLGEYREA